MTDLSIQRKIHKSRLALIFIIIIAISHIGLSLKPSLETRNGPAGASGFPPSPLAVSAEQRRLGFMRDPYVFIQTIKSFTNDDSIIAVPDMYEGEFVEGVGSYYLFPRRIIRVPSGGELPDSATHVVASSAPRIVGAHALAEVSGHFILYSLPSR